MDTEAASALPCGCCGFHPGPKPGLGLRERVFASCDSWAGLTPGRERQRWDTRYLLLREAMKGEGCKLVLKGCSQRA